MALWSLLMLELWHRGFVDGDYRQAKPHTNQIVLDHRTRASEEREHIQTWEREEVRRSAIEAAYTVKSPLRYSTENIVRYTSAVENTHYALEYSHYLLGDIRGKTGSRCWVRLGENSVLLATGRKNNRPGHF